MNVPPQPIYVWNPSLRVSEQSQGGSTVFVIQDPDSGEHFQLGESEYRIARQFDGTRTAGAVADLTAGQDLAAADIAAFAAQLASARILLPADASAESGAARRVRHRSPVLTRVLFLQLAAFQPDAFFRRTLDAVRPFLSRPALVLGGGVVLLAVAILLGNTATLRDSIAARFSASALLAVWACFGVVVVLHEMAHGYVCAHFGGRVQSMGFLLMYGKPCAYCDVSDAWLFPRKLHKIWVMAAGILLELFLWAAATLVWRVSAPETWAHGVALIVMTVCGVGTLFNFNPLLKLDGYYILSDAIEVPNLRERAFRDVWLWMRRQPRQARTQREARIFLAYGALALLYSAAVLGFVLLQLQGWVTARWGAGGLLLLWTAIGVASARPLARVAAWFFVAFRNAVRTRRFRWTIGVVAGLAVLALVRWPLKVSSECRIEPLARVVVRADVDGRVERVDVREGDIVADGAPLVTLATLELDHDLERARADLGELGARLALLQSGARTQEIEIARRRVEAASTRLEYDQKAHERAQQSLASDLVSREAVEEAERTLRLSQDEHHSARQALALLESGARPQEVAAMQARIDAVTAQIRYLEEQRRRTHIASPIPGQVLTPHLERLTGRFVERGDSLLVVADLSAVLLQIPVPEKDVGDVRQGARVRFKSRTHAGRVFEGEVVSIAPAAQAGEHQKTILVQSRIANPDGVLRADTTGFAKIYCGDRALGTILSRRGVRMLRTEFWALW
jgi:multidrug resistance efflux pump